MDIDNRIKNVEELPLILNVSDIAKILGISKANAYTLCHSSGFPATKAGERRMIIPKPAFVKWLENPTDWN